MNAEISRKFPIVRTLFVGGVGDEVTGSNILLEITNSDGKVRYGMIDAGAVQGENEYMNFEYPIDGSKIDFILITHAHFDHIGSLPLLYKHGFRGKIFTTNIVKALAYPMLIDAANINVRNASFKPSHRKTILQTSNRMNVEKSLATKYQDIKNLDSMISQFEELEFEPLYTPDMVEGVIELFETVAPYANVQISDGIFARFIPTTHQNGSCKIELYIIDGMESYNMVFSGDIGPENSLLYEQTKSSYNEAIDCYVMESLHGTNPPVETLTTSIKRLNEIIKKGIRQRKHIVLAGFSLDRNAILIYLMNDLKKRGVNVDVFIDSPLTMTQLLTYELSYEDENNRWFKNLGGNPFNTDHFNIIKSNKHHLQSVLHGDAPRVIITASANGNGGRVTNYFKNGIQRDDYVFVFCGWIHPNSPSDILHEAKNGDVIEINGEHYVKQCKTYRLHGLTSHGYFKEMLTSINDYPNCSTLILNHGRNEAKEAIKERVEKFFGGSILIPKLYQAYEFSKDSVRELLRDEYMIEFDSVITNKAFFYGEVETLAE